MIEKVNKPPHPFDKRRLLHEGLVRATCKKKSTLSTERRAPKKVYRGRDRHVGKLTMTWGKGVFFSRNWDCFSPPFTPGLSQFSPI